MIELLVAFVLWEANADWNWWAAYGVIILIQVWMAIRGDK